MSKKLRAGKEGRREHTQTEMQNWIRIQPTQKKNWNNGGDDGREHGASPVANKIIKNEVYISVKSSLHGTIR